MPRVYGKKGDKDDDFVVQVKKNQDDKKEDIGQSVLNSFIEDLLKDHPYWIKKSRKLTCSLCSVNVQFSSILAFKTEISTHMNSKRHKKKIGSYFAGNNHVENADKTRDNTWEQEEEKIKYGDGSNNLSDMLREIELNLPSRMESNNKNHITFNSRNCLTDFETTYCSLEKDNPVTQGSKKCILKAEDGRNYFCTICQEPIFDSINANEFRYNLWNHLNNQGHREKLPNFSKVERDFKKLLHSLSKKLPANLKDNLKYIEIGPVFQFVKCSLCNVAVSENFHRLKNHIEGGRHKNNKEKGLKEYSERSTNTHTHNWFVRLIADMETQFKEAQFKEDLEYIHIGKMPGYVICSLCSHVVLPTFYYMKVHFVSDYHIKNKTANLIKWESTFKTDLLKTLQGNPMEQSQFEESKYGVRCRQCNMTMPATPYALYSHTKTSGCVPTL